MSVDTGQPINTSAASVTTVNETSNSAGTLLLWPLWALLLFAGLVAGNFDSPSMSECGRLGSSVVLVFAGWVWYLSCRNTAPEKYTLLIAIGMTLGGIGDFFMGGLFDTLIPLPSPVLGGMASFGLGHIIYIIGCFEARLRAQLTSSSAMWGSIIFWQAASTIGWYFVVFLSTKESTQLLVWPALGYSQLLAGTAGVTTGLAVQDRRFVMLAIGAALFLISDLILGWGMFRETFPHRMEAVWIPYGGGQMMIVYAIVTARKAFQNC